MNKIINNTLKNDTNEITDACVVKHWVLCVCCVTI